ncbi:LuxR C-terminal-related transcriptional regulator [Buttiauxella noackiae]|uniref:LuxR C-terminal-related transcriptional regulator n=1 Tax=Buttiauxella noackiae TaxID=82992 RepID=UPI002356602F|nr:LuxR C-terminal-related transcriptional regulator [Buttiauxella noackiae]MCA1921319.1 LuxR C-terminal-related transcriptional regulator [Buttiauxella noackiae]
MKKDITAINELSHVMVVMPCVLTAAGISHQLKSRLGIKDMINIINNIDEAYDGTFKIPHSMIILNVSQSSKQLAEEIRFIKWYRKEQSNKNIVIYTHNHKVSILKYLSSLGVQVIISQYELPTIFMELLIKSLSSTTTFYSPMIEEIMQKKMPGELTVCEAQVIEQLFLGHNVTQIAQHLGRDIRTVSSHKRHAMQKLGLNCDKDLHVLSCEITGKSLFL